MREAFDGVEIFVEAAEAGSFARAAERLALTRSAVGKTIARLEERLGARLFHRTTRSQNLTEEGQIYYERCLRALAELRLGGSMIEAGRREVSGRLKVSMPGLFGRHCVTPILLRLAREHPALELDLRYSDQITDVIADGYDLVIRNGHRGESAGLHARRIATQEKILCAAPDYLARHPEPKNLVDLSDHDALVYWRNDAPFPWTFVDTTGGVSAAVLRWRLQFDNLEAIVEAATVGMGIASLPSWLVRHQLADGRLIRLLADVRAPSLETYAVWPSARYIPMRLRVAIDRLVSELQSAVDG